MKNQKFSDAYMNLTRKNKYHLKVRNEIINECRISSTVFYNWVSGVTNVPFFFQDIVAKHLNMKKEELFQE